MTVPASRSAPSPIRDLVIVAALLVFTNGPLFFVSRRVLSQEASWEDAFVRPVLVATALAAVGLVVLDPVRTSGRRLLRPSPVAAAAIVVFTGWAVLSSVWSVDPSVTRGRAVLYIGLGALAWVIADLDPLRVRRAILAVGIVAVGASLAAVVFSDSIGLDLSNNWRGIYTNRNSLAPICAVTIIVGLAVALEGRRGTRRGALVVVAVSGVVMAGSGSRTAWLGLAVALGVATTISAAPLLRRRFGDRALVAVGGVGLAGLAVVAAVVSWMWDEPTLAQRRTIWELVWEKGAERPLHGHGWFVIWGDPEFTATHELLARGSAHGSFFEVWVGLGLVGLVAFLAVVGLALVGAVRDAWRAPSIGTGAWLALVCFLVIENLTESFVLWFSYNWVLLMAAALRSGVGLRRGHDERMPAPTSTANA